MNRWTVPAIVASTCLLLSVPAYGQTPPSCEDQLRATRVLAEQVVRSRSLAEAEMSTTIGALLKQVDTLRQEVEHLKTKLPKEEPK